MISIPYTSDWYSTPIINSFNSMVELTKFTFYLKSYGVTVLYR